MMYFRCVIQYLPQKPTNICGLLCAILIVSLSSTRADSGTTHSISLSNYHCPAPTLQETLAPPLGFCSFDTQAFSFKHNHAASDQPLSARVAEVIVMFFVILRPCPQCYLLLMQLLYVLLAALLNKVAERLVIYVHFFTVGSLAVP